MAELPVVERDAAQSSRRAYLTTAALCTASALFVAWVAATRQPGLNAPPSIAYVVAFIFALTALRLLQLRGNATSEGHGFTFLFCSAMAVIGGWIAFGGGPRACTGSVNDGVESTASGLACRIPFGLGAVLTGAIALYALVRFVRSRALFRS